jgi:hypothetical protein
MTVVVPVSMGATLAPETLGGVDDVGHDFSQAGEGGVEAGSALRGHRLVAGTESNHREHRVSEGHEEPVLPSAISVSLW